MEMNSRENHQYEESSEWFVKYMNRQGDWLEKTRGNLMVAATVIAGMSFQVMVSPPGGVWQDDNCSSGNQTGTAPVCKGKAGTSVLEHNSSKRGLYLGMVISSTVSFTASMSLILLVISGLRLRNRMIMAILVTFMVAAVLCISAAFFCAIALVQSEDQIIIYILLASLCGILGSISCFNTRKPTSSVFGLAYLVHMLLLSTSPTVYSTAVATGSGSVSVNPWLERPTYEIKMVSSNVIVE